MTGASRTRAITIGTVLVIIAVIAAAFALGGNDKSLSVASSQAAAVGQSGVASEPGLVVHGGQPELAPSAPTSSVGSGGSSTYKSTTTSTAAGSAPGGTGRAASRAVDASVGSTGVGATRVVKTGQLSMTVKKGRVALTIAQLTQATISLGGYVSQSRTDDVGGSPAGSLTLRIPVNRFEDAITTATRLGHETSLTTNANDVTGKFVDLSARLTALKHTRATYLTILSRARTIGQTLSVQQRVNDIQQQIEQLQGELKVLRNQSADGTLTIAVSEAGALVTAVTHHHRSGWSKAWHRSTGRFNRGIQAIIGGLGPLLLALLLIGFVLVVIRVGTRRTRRAET